MKKSTRLFLVSTVALLTGLVAVSCSNVTSYAGSQNIPTESCKNQAEAIQKFGKVNRIFSAPTSSSRFYTGQKIKNFWGMKNNIVFEGNLVEYNSVNPTILNYVENIPAKNALMHQGYGKIDYIKGKTYVEFSSYKDVDNDAIVMFEVRIFDGDFWNNRNEDGWYAKSVTFSPDFKIDVHEQKNIITGAHEVYKYPYAVYEGQDDDENETGHFTNEIYPLSEKQKTTINKLGKVNKIFKAYRYEGRFCSGQQMPTPFWGLKNNIQLEANLVEYNSFNGDLLNYIKKQEKNAYLNQNYIDQKFQHGKIYVEVNSYKDMDNGETIWVELRLVDDSYITEGFKNTWYARSVTFSPDFTIDVDHNKNISTGDNAYYEYPHAKRN